MIPVKSGYQPAGADDAARRMLAETKLFNAEQIGAEMSAGGGLCNLVILDACRNTPVARDPRVRDAAGGGGLSEMKPPAGSLIALSTDAGRTAQDGTGANGLYTEELLKNLRTPGITIEQAFKRTRAGVMQRSEGAQIPAEYSRLVGDDIYLAGPGSAPVIAPADTPPVVSRAEPVKPLSPGAIYKLAAAGKAAECVEALKLRASILGGGGYAAAPLGTLLERVKEDLKPLTAPSPRVEAAMKTCELVLEGIATSLPLEHPERTALLAKAHNRRGDCLLLLGRPAEARPDYDAAVRFAPADPYPVYNRGRAHLALGHREEAITDFTAAVSDKFKQTKARQLARKALEEMK